MDPDHAFVDLQAAFGFNLGHKRAVFHPSLGELRESNGVNNEEQSNPDLQELSIASPSLRVSSTFDAPQLLTGASTLLGHHTIIILPTLRPKSINSVSIHLDLCHFPFPFLLYSHNQLFQPCVVAFFVTEPNFPMHDDRERALDMQVHLAGLSPQRICIMLEKILAGTIAAGGLLIALCFNAARFGPWMLASASSISPVLMQLAAPCIFLCVYPYVAPHIWIDHICLII